MRFHATSLAGAVALFTLATSQCRTVDAKGLASWFGKSHQPIQVREYDDKNAFSNLKRTDGKNDMAQASEIMYASINGPSDISTASCPVDLGSSSPCRNTLIPTHHHHHHEQQYVDSHAASQYVESPYLRLTHKTNVGHGACPSSHRSGTGISMAPTTTPTKAGTTTVADTGEETTATMLSTPRSADEPHFRYSVMDHIQKRFGQVVNFLSALAPHQDDEIQLYGEDDDDDDDAVEFFDEEDVVADGVNEIKKRRVNDDKDEYGHFKGWSPSSPSPSLASGNRDRDTATGVGGAEKDGGSGGFDHKRADHEPDPTFSILLVFDKIKRGLLDTFDFDRHKDDVHFDDVGKTADRIEEDEHTSGALPVVDKLKRDLPKAWGFGHHKDHQESDKVSKGERDMSTSTAHVQKRHDDNDEKYTTHSMGNIDGEDILARILDYIPRKVHRKIHRDASLHVENLKTEAQNFVSQKKHELADAASEKSAKLKNEAYGYHLQQQNEDLKYMAADKIAHAQQGMKDYAHQKQQEAAQRRAEEAALKKRQDQEAAETRVKEKKAAEEDAKRFTAEQAAAAKAEAHLQKQLAQLLAQERKETEEREVAQRKAAKKAAKDKADVLKKLQTELAAIDKKAAASKASLDALIAAEGKAHEALQDAENKKHEAVIKITQDKIVAEKKAVEAKKLADEKAAMAKLKKRQDKEEKAAKKEAKKAETEAKKRRDMLEKHEVELENVRRAKVVAERMVREARLKAEHV
ncbi:hypothetical protein EDD21DRAFT_376009 [Dissophora ornata]|nr:hypothetical protein BGZ58_001415 [Dissophora ornata]KAI8600867.1 hypothetical protein EDD21DRAFT_376009 [Dissophora ornata]